MSSSRGKPIANPVVVLREEFDDWAVLFNPDTACAVGINPIGALIWKQLNGDRDIEEIVAVIRTEFDQVPDSVRDEVSAFIATLEKNGFVGSEIAPSDVTA